MKSGGAQNRIILCCLLFCFFCGFQSPQAAEKVKLEKLSTAKLEKLEARANEGRNLFYQKDYQGAEAIFRELSNRITVSQPLYCCELGMCLLAQGKNEEAFGLLLKSYGDLLEFFDPKTEKKALNLWGGESKKIYKGDPYEQSTLCLLLGVLFLEKGDVDNALACFKSGQLADSDVENESYKTDFALLQLLESYCYYLRKQPELCNQVSQVGLESFLSTADSGQDTAYLNPLMEPFSFNTLVLVMSGKGPLMERRGEYGENRIIVINDPPTNRFEVQLDETDWYDAIQGVGDINFQSSTRGGRMMDNVLAGHARTKRTTNQVGNAFLDAGRNTNNSEAAIVLMGIGLLVKGISATMTAAADIRCWQTLPASIQPLPLNLDPGIMNSKSCLSMIFSTLIPRL